MVAKMNEKKESASMIVVMGVTGAGKSYFVNQLARKSVVKEGESLESCK
jgi:predicted GTPase